MLFKKVYCRTCKSPVYRSRGRVNENLKLGHNFYCSRGCEYQNRTTAKTIICENCNKRVVRQISDILSHNYCSQSCAAHINNMKFPKRARPFSFCSICKKQFKSNRKYCSQECNHFAKIKFTREEVINAIRISNRKLTRVPAKRELKEIVAASRRCFGSWNNAITAAGLKPYRSHDNRMYKRINAKARDGHTCDSVSEAIIDNWFSKNSIEHTIGVRYPNANYRADWLVGNTYVEYFGLAKDSPRYDREIKKKINFCRTQKLKLIEIYPKDLYPNIMLDSKLRILQKI